MVLQSGTRLINNVVPEWSKIEMVNLGSVNNKFNIFCFCGLLARELKDTSQTAKVLRSNLTGSVLVFYRKYYVSKEIFGLLLLMFCRRSCHMVDLFFFLYTIYIVVALRVSIYFGYLYFLAFFFRFKLFFCPNDLGLYFIE